MSLNQLYERDFNLWVEKIKQKLIERDFNNMDWDNLIEELDDMGASHKRALESYLQRLIEHILKLRYWHSEVDRCRNSWKSQVSNFRNRINRILKKNPSLKNYLAQEYSSVYEDAVKNMSFEFDIPKDSFFELEQIMQEDFF